MKNDNKKYQHTDITGGIASLFGSIPFHVV